MQSRACITAERSGCSVSLFFSRNPPLVYVTAGGTSNYRMFRSNYGMFRSNYGMFRSNYGMFHSNYGMFRSNYGMFRSNCGTFPRVVRDREGTDVRLGRAEVCVLRVRVTRLVDELVVGALPVGDG